ncbi:MAG: NPCBM/NEW2 domain-containing protein [Gemmataceae bacterium]|nr:NPCBM/NEW2 domain-containing protein [Gemmataceae bacterium]
MILKRTHFALWAVLFGVAFASADTVRTLSNKNIEGTIVAVTDKEVSIRVEGGGVVKTPLNEVLALDLQKVKGVDASYKYSDLRLVDESLLHCTKVAFQGNQIHATLLSGQEIKLPIASLSTYLREAHDPAARTEWEKILGAQDIKRDRVVIDRKGVLNPVEGTFGDVSPKGDKIQFRLEGGVIHDVEFARVGGMIFYRPEPQAKSPVCQVIDVQGNVLSAAVVKLEGNALYIKTLGGLDLRYDQQLIARFDYNMGKLTYLSDLTPSKVVERSGVGLPIAFRKDVNLDGEQILLGDKTFPKGLSLHAYTELEYKLDGKYKEFKAFIGVDPRVGSESKARVTIESDGRQIFAQEFTAEMPVRQITLPVQRARSLRIVVSSTNLLDLHDHVTLADAKVSQ